MHLFVRWFLMFILVAVPWAVSVSLNVNWNLFTPVLSADMDVNSYLQEIGLDPVTDVRKMWVFDNGAWKKYIPGADNSVAGNFSTMKPGLGYWILMNAAKTVNLSDALVGYSLSLASSGWKLIGLNCSRPVMIDSTDFLKESNFVSGSVSNIVKVWGYVQGGWKKFIPGGTNNGLTEFTPGYGYWFYLNDGLSVDSKSLDLSDLFPPVCPGCPGFGQ